MAYTKRIVCFANSWKKGGSCIAGRELTPNGWGPWIRPVSARATHEISHIESRYASGGTPALLDVIDMSLHAATPAGHQTENHQIDGSAWSKTGALLPSQAQSAVDHPGGPLWINGHSSGKGTNDYVPEPATKLLARSLYLISPDNLCLASVHDSYKNQWQIRAQFTLSGADYCLSLTDPVARSRFQIEDGGMVRINPALVCVSLSEVLNGSAYKLVAGLIVI